jgi:hypothetical protein
MQLKYLFLRGTKSELYLLYFLKFTDDYIECHLEVIAQNLSKRENKYSGMRTS